MTSPLIARVPQAHVVARLGDDQWSLCVKSWTSMTSLALRLTSDSKSQSRSDPLHESLVEFLLSFVDHCQPELQSTISHSLLDSKDLRKNVFLLFNYMYVHQPPKALVQLDILLQFCYIFGRKNFTMTRRALNSALSYKDEDELDRQVEEEVDQLCAELNAFVVAQDSQVSCSTHRISIMAQACTGSTLAVHMARPRLSKALVKAYNNEHTRAAVIRQLALVLSTNPAVSLKFLNGLIGSGENNPLFEDLVRHTAFIEKLTELSITRPELNDVLSQAQSFAVSTGGDSDFNDTVYDETQDGQFLEKVSQIKDLFPDLEDSYISACLKRYGQDTETTTIHLLDDDVDLEIRTEHANGETPQSANVPEEIHPPARLNIYDNDDFDRLKISDNQVKFGRDFTNADNLLKNGLSADVKHKVLSLAFDSDEDEPDDTYEGLEGIKVNDFQTTDDLDEAAGIKLPSTEETLYATYTVDHGVFEKSARRSAARSDLKARTNLSDEQIEGWKSMLLREPARARRLAAAHELTDLGNRKSLPSSKWTKPSGESSDDSPVSAGSHTYQRQHQGAQASNPGVSRGGRGTRPRGRYGTRTTDSRSRGRGRGRGRGSTPNGADD